MKKIKVFYSILIVFITICSCSSNPQNFLILGKTFYSEISPQKLDTFYVQMRSNEFASIRITEKHVRINARVYDPQNSLIQYKDENQMGDKEVVTIFSKESGIYKIIVGWNFNEPLTGKYTITLDKLEGAGNNAVEKSKQLFDGWYEKYTPGAALLVIKNEKVVLKLTKGLANLEDNIPIRTSSLFELASCSKQFTGYDSFAC
ncbi:serine hydrolase domain-containing protein [Chryseolinea sp. H1M3-3]|uniref:serine hydrolase n=1 Tax=Chryseolinea sp. H1M3-3 TaxID=3034144 RepID=UPI0023EC24FC|nr:serine hydrolase domain-containing protein [Chryseolinea sp. H1M3-3]